MGPMLKDLHEKLQKRRNQGNTLQVLGMCEEGADVKAATALIPNT